MANACLKPYVILEVCTVKMSNNATSDDQTRKSLLSKTNKILCKKLNNKHSDSSSLTEVIKTDLVVVLDAEVIVYIVLCLP